MSGSVASVERLTIDASSAPVIQLVDVGKRYVTRGGPDVVALSHLDLTVGEGEFVVLVGPSGCGKSTVLKLVAGLLPSTSGTLMVDGSVVRGPRRDTGFVFQTPVLLPWRSVRDNVLLPIEMLGQPRREFQARAEALIRQVGLAEFAGAQPRALSGGMQQRVGICRALIHDPRILLMDEPFSALDALTREELAVELLRIWEERRKTVLFVTHSILEAVLLADRVVVMTPRPGRIAGVVPVSLPRPRTLEMEYAPEFQQAARTVRRLIDQRGAPSSSGVAV